MRSANAPAEPVILGDVSFPAGRHCETTTPGTLLRDEGLERARNATPRSLRCEPRSPVISPPPVKPATPGG